MGVPGGSGLGLMMSLTNTVEKFPEQGISQYLQTVLVGRESVRISNNFAFINNKFGSQPDEPKIAHNWGELEDILQKKGISSIQGITC